MYQNPVNYIRLPENTRTKEECKKFLLHDFPLPNDFHILTTSLLKSLAILACAAS